MIYNSTQELNYYVDIDFQIEFCVDYDVKIQFKTRCQQGTETFVSKSVSNLTAKEKRILNIDKRADFCIDLISRVFTVKTDVHTPNKLFF